MSRPYIMLSNNELQAKYISYRNWAKDQHVDAAVTAEMTHIADGMLLEIEARKQT